MVRMPNEVVGPEHSWHEGLRAAVSTWTLIATATMALAAAPEQKNFASTEAGSTALIEAIKSNDEPALGSILGPNGSQLISSGDEVADTQSREAFIKAYNEAHKLVLEGDTQAILVIGKDEWPMPIPLVKSQDGWHFDTTRGAKEILDRRIGRNELNAIQVCLAIVDAERDYVAKDPDGDGIPEYASKFVSTPGKHDGLYWETNSEEPPSPLGPLLAAAARETGTQTQNPVRLSPTTGTSTKFLRNRGRTLRVGHMTILSTDK